jgi:CopG family nickel-responsive transcriptional regulator
MQRFTISLEEGLARQFDDFIAERGYGNRSEAVRDLIRRQLGDAALDSQAATWCAACVSFVYDQHDQPVTQRVMALQHDNHDLIASSLHTYLDHDNCLETLVLRGPQAAVRACAQALVALRGVRHGQVHLVPLARTASHHHHDSPMPAHVHFTPVG